MYPSILLDEIIITKKNSIMKILVTGAAGFIGFHLCHSLLKRGDEVIGVDNMNSYYDVSLKEARLSINATYDKYHMYKMSVSELEGLEALFSRESYDCVVHLAAQAGVRYSLDNPKDALGTNILGMINVLEMCRKYNIPKLVYASSSSVYGNSSKYPYNEGQKVDIQISPYATSKKCCEFLAESYSNIYGLLCVGLRFFTVYGPWGRPDMAPLIFANSIKDDKPIKLYDNGTLYRDFTYIDDIINGINSVIDKNFEFYTYRHHIYNLGNGSPVAVAEFLQVLENVMAKHAITYNATKPECDVPYTFADITKASKEINFSPKYNLQKGIPLFVEWFNQYYKR